MNTTKKLCWVFAAVMAAVTAIFMWSCGKPAENISERRSGYYTASDDAFTVTVVSGAREDPFVADGVAGALTPYTLITAVPKAFDVDAVVTYAAKTHSKSFGGTMVVHPFAASFSAEIGAEITGELTVTLTIGGEKHEYKMVSGITPDMLGFDDAVKTAIDRVKPNGKYEIRARIIKNPLSGDGLCWHVAFVYGNEKENGVLLDPVTGRVLAKK